MTGGRLDTSAEITMPYDVRAVANFFLDRADEAGQELDHMKLQKLAYIAHGWHLAVTGEPLFYERVEAWPYGPVIPDLYHALKQHGRRPIKERLTVLDLETFEPVPASVERGSNAETVARSVEVLRRVWASYGSLSALQLSTLTHKPGSPWAAIAKQSATNEPRGLIMSEELIRSHYEALAAERRKARVG